MDEISKAYCENLHGLCEDGELLGTNQWRTAWIDYTKQRHLARWLVIPISPYLFFICSEGLSTLIKQAYAQGKLSGVRASQNGPAVTHLFLTDDSLIFHEVSEREEENLRNILWHYELVSGRSINYDKFDLFSARTHERRENNNVKKYLSLPTYIRRNKKGAFQYVKEMMVQVTRTWYSISLSRAGKEVMIKAMGQAIPIYVRGVFHIPEKLCREMEKWPVWSGIELDELFNPNKAGWRPWI